MYHPSQLRQASYMHRLLTRAPSSLYHRNIVLPMSIPFHPFAIVKFPNTSFFFFFALTKKGMMGIIAGEDGR